MKETTVNFGSALEKLMDEAISKGATPLEIFEEGIGKIINRSLAKGVHPASMVFEFKTAEYQLVHAAVHRSRQEQTVLEAISEAGLEVLKGGSPLRR
jgi:hypothetical protein